ncbi:GMC oxidoreductase [Micromonospora sp. NPDC049051]|uniref:GMC oxidoreductase n=1 Tax=Micromonospora sp. NPDC049051 TaxID=3364264 RepID=UPI003721B054
MIIDEHVDVVVVGLGAAGGTIAAALAERGLDVVGLEAGPQPARPDDYTDDELVNSVDRKHLWTDPEVLDFEGAATTATWLKRNRGVGGPFAWSGFAYRFHPSDFRVASTVGIPDGSSVEDWPIDYDEMTPWYEAAEQLIGVSGDAGTYPFEPPRRGPFPQRPVRRVPGTTLLDDAARSLGWHPYQPPAAILSAARGERSGCSRCGLCTNYACHRDAKASSSVFALPLGLRTGRLRLAGDTLVTEVVCDPVSGRPRGVRYLRSDGTAGEQPASVVVLANNAVYVAKLLLQSTSTHHRRGLGNDSDQVGRHLTFHTGGVAWGVYDEQLHVDSGPAQQVAVDDLNEDRPWRAGAGFRRGGVLHGGMPVSFAGGPLLFARALGGMAPLPAGVPAYGQGLMEFAAHAYTRHQAVYSLGEDLPQADNRVVLDPERRDSAGTPAVRMRYRRHPEDIAQIEHLVAASVRLLEASGATMIASAPSAVPGGMFAGHAHGTTRMGTDPATSVADDRGLVHGTTNLFVAGAGLFVTGAGLNPMLTITALALRAVDAIADAAR